MTQLTLPLRKPAGPLRPLTLDGASQAVRMAVLAEIADCRLDLWLSREGIRWPSDIAETNHRRHSAQCLAEACRIAISLGVAS